MQVQKKKQMQTLAASTNVPLQNTGGNGHIALVDVNSRLENYVQFWETVPCVRGAFKIDWVQNQDEKVFGNMSSKQCLTWSKGLKEGMKAIFKCLKSLNGRRNSPVLYASGDRTKSNKGKFWGVDFNYK